MRQLLFIAFIFSLQIAVLSQSEPTRSQQLNASVATLYQAGKYDDAIPVAEEIVSLERKEGRSKNIVNALENLAQIEVARFKRSMAELNSGSIERKALKDAVAKYRKDAENAEVHLREALQLADKDAAMFREQSVLMRNSLAWLLYNYQPLDPEASVAFDKTSRDKFEMRTKVRALKRISEAGSLYEEALKLGSENSGEVSYLLTTFNAAEFALATGDLEGAIARFEKCISEVERRYGKNSANLVQPLEGYIKALAATSQDDLAFEMVSRLVRITGKSAGIPKTLVHLSLRADRAFALSNATSVEETARANKESATLSGRAATVNSSLDAILSASTLGRQYYDVSGPISISKVVVRVLVDETGKAIEVEGMTLDKERKRDAEAAVREWKFRPFTAAGQARKMRGYVETMILAGNTSK